MKISSRYEILAETGEIDCMYILYKFISLHIYSGSEKSVPENIPHVLL